MNKTSNTTKWFISLTLKLIMSVNCFALGHFTPAFTGNGNDQMTLYVLSAQVEGVDLESGDEIAIFDGPVCCGVKILTQTFNFEKDGIYVDIPASKADAGLSNGYTPGHLISYKFWDSSQSKEITAITGQYYNPLVSPPVVISAPAFSVGESAFVKLSGSSPYNQPPVAKAGTDQSVNEGTTVTLDGTASSDPDNDPITYLWTAPEGITLSSATAARPTFIAPKVALNSDFTFTLVVKDALLNSIPDQVIITVTNVDHAPYVKDSIKNITVNLKASEQIIDLNSNFADDDFGDVLAYHISSNTNDEIVVPNIVGNNLHLSFSTRNIGLSDIEITATSNNKEAKSKFTVEVKLPSGIDQQDEAAEVLIFPNPSKGIVQMKFNQIPKDGTWITISNNSGKVVYRMQAMNKIESIIIKDKSPGIYFLKVEQKIPKTYKIVVE